MSATAAHYNVTVLREAVQAVQRAVGDPEADGDTVAFAHIVIAETVLVAPPIVGRWIGNYLQSISRATGRSDVSEAVDQLATHFKLPPCRRTIGFGEQGQLFD